MSSNTHLISSAVISAKCQLTDQSHKTNFKPTIEDLLEFDYDMPSHPPFYATEINSSLSYPKGNYWANSVDPYSTGGVVGSRVSLFANYLWQGLFVKHSE